MAAGPFSRPIDPQPFQNTVDDWENRAIRDFKPTGGNAPASGRLPNGFAALNYGAFSPYDLQGFDVSPRQRLYALANAVALPVGNTQLLLNAATLSFGGTVTAFPFNTLSPDDGLLVESMAAFIQPALGAGAVVTIRDLSLAIALSNSTIILPIGTPVLTTLTPAFNNSVAFQPPPLLAARDLDFYAKASVGGASIFAAASQPLRFILSIGFNDTVAASTVTVQAYIFYRIVKGLTGA